MSIAIPGSVIDNAQSADMAAVTAGQIARAAAIYRVVEIVILDDSAYKELVLNLHEFSSTGREMLF